MSKISVIVPVYKARPYICRCIDSVLAQTYTDFELILIDDGSPDDCGAICDRYAEEDSRIKVIHKENGGVSSARNAGLDIATGEYVSFIDSDDWVEDHYLENLITGEFDLTVSAAYYSDEKGTISGTTWTPMSETGLVSPTEVVRWYELGRLCSIWACLLKRDIIEKHSLRFDTNTTRGEDTIFMFEYIDRCCKVQFLKEVSYHYIRYGENGSASSTMNISNIYALDYIDGYLKTWFAKHGVVSPQFDSVQHWSKSEEKNYFLRTMISPSMSLAQKYSFYKAFFAVPVFTDNIDRFFKTRPVLKLIVSLKSPQLMLLCGMFAKPCYEVLFKIKSRKA